MAIRLKVQINKNLISKFTNETKKATSRAVKDVGQDLARTSSETTPHLTGDLEKSFTITYSLGGNQPKAKISVSAFKGGFNYAVAMHEWTYKLGEGSSRKGGGTGMSGKTYAVGNKYLTRVMLGEAKAYRDYIGDMVKNTLR